MAWELTSEGTIRYEHAQRCGVGVWRERRKRGPSGGLNTVGLYGMGWGEVGWKVGTEGGRREAGDR